jgi:hypothetical protein
MCCRITTLEFEIGVVRENKKILINLNLGLQEKIKKLRKNLVDQHNLKRGQWTTEDYK